MKYCIPGELWNQVGVPSGGVTATLVSTYISELAYRLPSITDVMMEKELWHTICEFAERCGALRERIVDTISPTSLSVTITTPTFGVFQRIVGASVNGVPVGLDKITVNDTAGGVQVSFAASLAPLDGTDYPVAIDISVVPDLNAIPSDQKAPLWFLKLYDRILIAGTVMRVCAMPGKPWTDEAGARMNATTYLHEINRVTHGLITSGMRKQILIDAESVLARQSQTTSTQSTSNTVG